MAPEGEATTGPWKCYFCGEAFEDAVTAGRHFGDGAGCDPDPPGCVHPLRSDEKARLRELELARAEVDLARRERDEAQDDADAYHAQCAELERLFGKGRRTAHQAWLELDAMEGRALAAEEALNRYRYAAQYAAADAWDGGLDIRRRFAWARGNDCGSELSSDRAAEIGQQYLATERKR